MGGRKAVDAEVSIVIDVVHVTHRSVLVVPDGDRERAAWLHLSDGVRLDAAPAQGRRRIFAKRSMIESRGLADFIEKTR